MIKEYSLRVEGALPVSSLTQNIARIVIFGVGILIILNSLGISVAPMLATLGVGGLAVALALQDTMANLFAGIFIMVNKQVRVGDYIRLDSGQEGYIADINWRSTKIRMAPNNLIFVPNSKLTQSIITNYYMPTRDTDVPIVFGVHYNSDLAKVERVVGEVAAATITALPDNTLAGVKPVVRFTGMGNSQIDMMVVIRASQFESQHIIKHTFIKMLLERFRREGIVIPSRI
jgi:small-conductance mechanosensitive channel